MFVLIARYTKPAEEVDRLLDGHRAWMSSSSSRLGMTLDVLAFYVGVA